MGVSEFKGKKMINIREYYEKEGKTLPGKKVGLLPSWFFGAYVMCLRVTSGFWLILI